MFLLEATATADENQVFIDTVEEITNGLEKGFHIPKIVTTLLIAAAIIIVARILIAIIRRTILNFSKRSKKFTFIMAQLVWKLCAALIWIIAIVAVLGVFGIDLTPVLAIMIALNSPFRVGDWVDIGDISGTVQSMDLMCVTLSSGDNKKITMNNKNVWGNTIVNYSYIEKRRLDMTVTVRYTDNLETAKNVIMELINSYPEILSDPAPLVEVGSYNDSSISIYVRPWVKPSDYWPVYWRFNADVLDTLRANGIDMPFNQMDVHLIQG